MNLESYPRFDSGMNLNLPFFTDSISRFRSEDSNLESSDSDSDSTSLHQRKSPWEMVRMKDNGGWGRYAELQDAPRPKFQSSQRQNPLIVDDWKDCSKCLEAPNISEAERIPV